jgi:ribulose-phosphate 3-epimerase
VSKLAASILAADLAYLADQVKMVEGPADLIHVDVMDAHFVPPLTIGPVVVASLRPHTRLALHAHLQVEAPEALFGDLAEAGTDAVSFHVEAVDDPVPAIEAARSNALRVGLALSPQTPVDRVLPHLDAIDHVVVLAVRPGWAGQAFDAAALPKIRALRDEVDRRGARTEIHVDGGVNLETGRRCLDAGADVLVAASAIFGTDDPGLAARELKSLTEAA